MRANDQAQENGAIWGRIGGSLMGVISGGNPDRFDLGAMLGSAYGLISNLRSTENIRVVQIPSGSVYVLELETAVTFPATPIAVPTAIPEQGQTGAE
jgi:hypothetical protein